MQKVLDAIVDIVFPKSKNILFFDLQPSPQLPQISYIGEGDHLACVSYKNQYVKDLIIGIKSYKDSTCFNIGAKYLGNTILKNIKYSKSVNIILIPIPISFYKKNQRGYNQCELLCTYTREHIEETTNKQCEIKINTEILRKNKHILDMFFPKEQKNQNRTARIKSSRNIFRVNHKKLSRLEKTKDITLATKYIVIDDVLTTGSTLSSAKEALAKFLPSKDIITIALAH